MVAGGKLYFHSSRRDPLQTPAMAASQEEKKPERAVDKLADALNDLFTSVSAMVKGKLQETGNSVELLEKMNVRVAEEYDRFGEMASGLQVFAEHLNSKGSGFDEYVKQIDAMEQQVSDFEEVVLKLDKHVTSLELKVVESLYQHPPTSN